MQNFIVYKHTSPSGKVYIGQTCQKIENRWKNGEGYKQHPYFYNAIQKYGWENFKHEIVADGLTKEEACDLEKFLIWRYNSTNPKKGYNLSLGGNGGRLGLKHSDETKQKLSEAHRGKHLSDEHRRKISEYNKGEKNHFYGKHHTEESCKKISEKNRGRKHSEETRRKISEGNKGENNAMYGKHHTEETKRKLSESLRGKYCGEKSYWYGKHLPKEACEKMSEAKKGRPALNRKPVLCIETSVVYPSITIASEKTGIHRQAIGKVCNGRANTAGGYHWKYI